MFKVVEWCLEFSRVSKWEFHMIFFFFLMMGIFVLLSKKLKLNFYGDWTRSSKEGLKHLKMTVYLCRFFHSQNIIFCERSKYAHVYREKKLERHIRNFVKSVFNQISFLSKWRRINQILYIPFCLDCSV